MDSDDFKRLQDKVEQSLDQFQEMYVMLSGHPPDEVGLFERVRNLETKVKLLYTLLGALALLVLGVEAPKLVAMFI